MIINSTLIFCLIPELEEALLGLKIDEINISSDRKELLFFLRDKNKKISLYLSTHPLDCRIEIWDKDEIDQHQKTFQRTNLFSFAIGGYVQKIEQVDFDRLIRISCAKKTQFGAGESFNLIFELTGRNSNMVLVKEDEMMVDCLRKIDATQNRFRQILPGEKYVPPPPPKKRNPLAIKKEEFYKIIRTADQSILAWLSSHFTGVDRLLAQKIVIESGFDLSINILDVTENEMAGLWTTFSRALEQLSNHDLTFQIINDKDGDPQAISCVDLPFIPEALKTHFENLNSAIKEFFSAKLERGKRKKETHALSSVIHRALEKLKVREKKIEEDFGQAERWEEFRRFGDLLMMNKETIRKGQASFKLTDIFDPQNLTVEIPLDSKLGAIANAQVYFKKYRKAKDALSMIKKRRSETKEQIDQLEEISKQLVMHGDKTDLEEQSQSLIRLGLLRPAKSQTKEKKKGEFSPRRFMTKSGWEIFVGKDNKQNDYLTFRFAKPDDLWFHAQDAPGSHVLLRRKSRKSEPSLSELKESAKLAAYFSKARKEKKAEVIYTQVKYVRKPKRGKPGLVLVTNEKNILVEPGLPIRSIEPDKKPAPNLS